jgi:hypothetical protein
MKVWVDKVPGWKYGPAKVWDSELNSDFNDWLLAEGYSMGIKGIHLVRHFQC